MKKNSVMLVGLACASLAFALLWLAPRLVPSSARLELSPDARFSLLERRALLAERRAADVETRLTRLAAASSGLLDASSRLRDDLRRLSSDMTVYVVERDASCVPPVPKSKTKKEGRGR